MSIQNREVFNWATEVTQDTKNTYSKIYVTLLKDVYGSETAAKIILNFI